ncbi:MAG: sugar phosphate isomerase/epimerase [Roseiflexaceae bacterium]|mgnify:CR=1 FL=1|nr:sugar phosphate isomerase/epimerase [Roseiflexaceae bacterium]
MCARGSVLVGMNARLFPINWRPARQEIDFAAKTGFDSIQFNGREQGIDAAYLGDELDLVGAALRSAGIAPVMEIVVRLTADGRTQMGRTPLDVLHANLPAIEAFGCVCVHWHLAPATRMTNSELRRVEREVIPQLEQAVAIATAGGFRFGLEHNEPDIPLFAEPGVCAITLAEVPGLGFVWDLNHAPLAQVDRYLELAPRMSMLHVSDTPLPEVNHHLPIGLGSIEFGRYFEVLASAGFAGPAILEIGGLPKSGGYGRDSDQVLADSLMRLREILGESYEPRSKTKNK